MGAIQSSVNQALGTAAVGAALVSSQISPKLDEEMAATVEERSALAEERDAESIESAKTAVDEASLHKKLAYMELTNPSESNDTDLAGRLAESIDAAKALKASKKALTNTRAMANIRSMIRKGWQEKVANLRNYGGIIGKVRASRLAENERI